jgi:thioredoxin 1
VVADNDIVLIDFWAAWCGPCQMFAPIYERSPKHPDIVFGKVDTEVEQMLAGQFGIMSIPTLAILRDGVVVFSQPGVLPDTALEDLIGRSAPRHGRGAPRGRRARGGPPAVPGRVRPGEPRPWAGRCAMLGPAG